MLKGRALRARRYILILTRAARELMVLCLPESVVSQIKIRDYNFDLPRRVRATPTHIDEEKFRLRFTDYQRRRLGVKAFERF